MTITKFYLKPSQTQEVGDWLERNLPNPPLPDAQRWSMITQGGFDVDIDFENENDALLFALTWGDGNPPARKADK